MKRKRGAQPGDRRAAKREADVKRGHLPQIRMTAQDLTRLVAVLGDYEKTVDFVRNAVLAEIARRENLPPPA